MIFRACLAKDARTGLSAQPKAGAGIKSMDGFLALNPKPLNP